MLRSFEDGKQWASAVRSTFDGLEIALPRRFEGAQMQVVHFGPGRAIELQGDAHVVERSASALDGSSNTVNVLLQTAGETFFDQSHSNAVLYPGDMVVLDGAQRFRLEMQDGYRHTVLQLPRDAMLRRYQGLARIWGKRWTADEPEAQFVFEVLSRWPSKLGTLACPAQYRGFDAMTAIIGMLEPAPATGPASGARYVDKALALISARLDEPDLGATSIASALGISRRRLDALFSASNLSVHRVIWQQRLQRAAADLANPSLKHCRIIDIAVSWGFVSESHFSRQFRREYGVSPSAYRRQQVPRKNAPSS